MPTQGPHQPTKRARRRAAIALGVLLAFTTWAGQAYAQTPDGPSAVDQYVEDVPTSGGATAPGKNKPKINSLPPSVSNQIDQQGGSDAAILREVATSPDYGAPAAATGKKAGTKANGKRNGKETAAGVTRGKAADAREIPAPADSSPSEAVSAAVSAVQGGDAGRLVGLLIALFVISIAALAAAGLRSRRRAGTV